MFDAPVRKKDAFVSRMRTLKQKPVRFLATQCRFIGMNPLEGDSGFVVKLVMPVEHQYTDMMRTWDDAALNAALENYQEWFPRADLNEDRLREFFRSSMTAPSIITALVSSVKEPIEVKVDGKDTSIFGVFQSNKEELRSLRCTIELEAQGLYFYPKRFGIRWMVRRFVFYSGEGGPSGGGTEEIMGETTKADIEEEWVHDVHEIVSNIEKDIVNHEKAVENLRTLRNQLIEGVATAKAEEEMTEKWNECLENVRLQMAMYQRGQN